MSLIGERTSVLTTGRLKVLIIDDEEVIRRTIRLALEKEFDVTEVAGIAESLKIFDQSEPNLILLDIFLPEIDGMEGLHQFRQRSAKIPVILISGHATFKLAQEALRLGATDYLTKPFTTEELRQGIKRALSKVQSENRFRSRITRLLPGHQIAPSPPESAGE